MRGRKPKPTVLKNLHGSTEPRNPDEPVAQGDLATDANGAPDYFDTEQREIWHQALRDAPLGMLKSIDASVLEVWVVAHAIHRKAVRLQARSGLVIPAPNTKLPIQSPYLPIINRQALIMMRAVAELGFSPTSRPRVGMALGGADLNGPRDGATTPTKGREESIDSYLSRAPDTSSVH